MILKKGLQYIPPDKAIRSRSNCAQTLAEYFEMPIFDLGLRTLSAGARTLLELLEEFLFRERKRYIYASLFFTPQKAINI